MTLTIKIIFLASSYYMEFFKDESYLKMFFDIVRIVEFNELFGEKPSGRTSC